MAGIVAYIYYDASGDLSNYVAIFNANNGEFIREVKYSTGSYAGYGDTVVVDANNNIYITGRWIDKILKLNSMGSQLVEVSANTPMALALAPDGSLWNFEYDGYDPIFIKRNPSTLAQEDSFKPLGLDYALAMAFDADGYLYVVDWVAEEIEKWDVVTHTRVAHRALTEIAADHCIYGSLTVMGSNVVMVQWAASGDGDDYFICPTDLSSNFVAHSLAEFPDPYWTESVMTFNKDSYILCGDVDVNEPEIEKGQTIIRYDSSFNVVWQVFHDGLDGGLSVSAYPYEVVEYDYPLAPVMFPAKQRGTTLREDCRNFEESMSDVCLVVNHNTVVTRRYLQETYGDTTYPESSNLRFILPSQQLVKLLNKDLTAEDYNAIINNFMTNISSMFTLINENNTLIKAWLDDYMPDEEGHEFTNVKMRPITIGEDLSKTMDNLFEGIIDNVTVLNMNLEVLKERF